jgi:hypothetical protein
MFNLPEKYVPPQNIKVSIERMSNFFPMLEEKITQIPIYGFVISKSLFVIL